MTGTGPADDRLPLLAPAERIGDAEREQAATALSEHFAAGRLDRAEFDVRLTAAYTARTADDLQPLFADLPAPSAVPRRRAGSAEQQFSPVDRPGRPGRRWLVPPLVPILLLVAVVTIATDGHFPFFIFPLLWFTGAFRHRRGW